MEYHSDDNVSVGRRMRQIRRAAHMTQEGLAESLGVTVNYLGEVERGRKRLSRNLADRFCQRFHVTYDYLYHGVLPVSQQGIQENAVYESVHSSLVEQLHNCSPQEIVIISQLVESYLDTSRHLQSQDAPQDNADGEDNANP